MKRIGILASGGDALGMNAAIRAVTHTALANDIGVCGVHYGYVGLVADDILQMTSKTVADKINRGSTFLYSARFPEFKEEGVQLKGIEQLRKRGIDALIVIGGDGSYHGASKLARYDYNVTGLPDSIDNDIPYTDFTVGFSAACDTAMEATDKIRNTATSRQRVFVVNAMGRDCGDIAIHVGVVTGANATVIPEEPYDIKEIAENLKQGFANGKKYGIVVLAEGVTDTNKFKDKLLKHSNFGARANILGHIQRGESLTAHNRVLASKMSAYAVKSLLGGKGGLTVGIENNRLSHHDILDSFDAKHHGNYALYPLDKNLAK